MHPMRMLLAALAFIAVAGAAAAGPRPAETWVSYVNSRFGTTIDYPADWFAPWPAPANNGGRSFTDEAGDASFLVFGQFNIDDQSMSEIAAELAREGEAVAYRAAKRDWAVVSGTYEGGARIFYRRAMLSHGGRVLHMFEIAYPRAAQADFGPVVTRMSRSLRAGEGYDTR